MRTFHIVVPLADADLAADRLWQLGVEAVGVDDSGDDHVELWTSVGESPDSLQRAVGCLEPAWSWRAEDVVEPSQTWRDHVAPTWYDPRGVVVPAWQPVETMADDVLVTTIEPATSFGLGDHPTTELTLGVLVEHLRSADVSSLLDVGCGSGVLGIVAAQLGVGHVRSVDISSGAIEATTANALRNGVAPQIDADTAALPKIDQPHDVVVANILAPTLVSLAPELKRLTNPAGSLIISGVLAERHEHVLEALRPMTVEQRRVKNGWAALLLRWP